MLPLIQDALTARGYDTLTPVQEAVSDPALVDKDLLVSAQTGSGKTVGFGIAIAPTLLAGREAFERPGAPEALIIAPTRELALQVMRELGWLYEKAGAVMASCVGGMDMRDERRALARGAHVVVGTPGRLRDHIERENLDMSALKAVVLDEADEMLDLGFREDLEFMLGLAPAERRTLLFSATVSPMIAKLAENYQQDAQRINTVSEKTQHADITYQALNVAQGDQEAAIFNLLRYYDEDSAIIFANTRAQVNHLLARLANRGFSVVSLSGELSQSERSHALQAMRDGRARVCVATDVAARGIDLPNLSLVIHADLPGGSESLLHRSGRTGRAGRKGISALIVPPKAQGKAKRLLKWAKITADWTTPPSAEMIRLRDEERLLSDPALAATPSEEEAAFAARLLESHSGEAIAAAYLRLYRERRAAPEELRAPNDTSKPDRAPFGPSRWVSLSVGRDDNAEPRWLLPLMCRAGGLDKSAIGAIRVRDDHSLVELKEEAYDGFMAGINGGELEEGVMVSPASAPPASAPPRGPNKGPYKGKPGGKPNGPHGGKPHHGKSFDGPKGDGRKFDKPKYDKPKSDTPKGDKPWKDKPKGDGPKKDKPWEGKPKGDKPKFDKPKGDKPWKDKPAGKPGAKPAGKPGGKPSKPTGDWLKDPSAGGRKKGKPAGKPGGKFSGKPGAKAGGKPGAPKPGPKFATKARKGGDATPRRKG